ncbi:MAG: shikimate dehydrogenase [Armatimonadetes bacterium]|nr:shikimate dehydrogenase [Armatimonadota bacterium]
MTRFAFILHPISARDVARKYTFARVLPDRAIEAIISHMPAQEISKITGVQSPTGAQTEGWFVGCTLTTRQLAEWDDGHTTRKVVEAAQMAQELGADIVGLGAFTAIVGNGGIDVAREVDIAVTTGNSYTVATAVEGTLQAAAMMELDPAQCAVTILGASGSIGRVCAHLLKDQVGRMTLVGRRIAPLEKVAAELGECAAAVQVSNDVDGAVRGADLIIAVTSATEAIVHPQMLKPGAVVCDVSRPRAVSVQVAAERDDVLVIEGGAVAVPGDVQFNFDFGFPPGLAYACMAETMILALEERIENFSLGKELDLDRVTEIKALADKHGFRLAGFRSFERAVDQRLIDDIKARARARRSAAE